MAKKTEKLNIDFDLIPLDELKDMVNRQVLDAQEQHKYKRTSKSKRQNKGLINYFGSMAYHLNNLTKTETDGNSN